VRRLIESAKPQSFAELLQIIGLSHGTGIWENNGDKLFAEHRLTLREIPVFAEDIYWEIAKKLREQGTNNARAVMTQFYPELKKDIIASWDRLFDEGVALGNNNAYGLVWEVRKEWIQKVIV
jgi:hypothetical protein